MNPTQGMPVTSWANDIGSEQNVSQSQLTGRGLINFEKDLREN